MHIKTVMDVLYEALYDFAKKGESRSTDAFMQGLESGGTNKDPKIWITLNDPSRGKVTSWEISKKGIKAVKRNG